MMEFGFGPCVPAEAAGVAALFYDKLSADPVFRAAFPDPDSARAHCLEFTEAYLREGEIHRLVGDGMILSAALWSLPGQHVPSPAWDFICPEPCCKLYLLASRRPGAGAALLERSAARFAPFALLTLCSEGRQAAYFARRGFEEAGSNAFGILLRREASALASASRA